MLYDIEQAKILMAIPKRSIRRNAGSRGVARLWKSTVVVLRQSTSVCRFRPANDLRWRHHSSGYAAG